MIQEAKIRISRLICAICQYANKYKQVNSRLIYTRGGRINILLVPMNTHNMLSGCIKKTDMVQAA